MTTLIMVQTADDVIVGSDSRATAGREVTSLVNPKVFRNGDIVFAVGGSTAALDHIEANDGFVAYDGSDPRKFLIRNAVPILRAMSKEDDFQDSNGNANFAVLMAVAGQAFEVDENWSITQNTDGIYTVGSGGDYARGSLYLAKKNLAGFGLRKDDVLDALEVAANIDAYTGGKLTVGMASKYGTA